MPTKFSPETSREIEELLAKYPTKMSACLPVLWLAQRDFGWIADETIELVATTLDLPASHVYGVVTFYTMFHRKPPGHYHVQVCTNMACMLRDAYEVLGQFERRLGVSPGERTSDGMFSLEEVECLGACGTAPCVQINDKYYEPVRPEAVDELVSKLRASALEAKDNTDAASGSSDADAGGAGEGSGGHTLQEIVETVDLSAESPLRRDLEARIEENEDADAKAEA